jgi:uncharacterized FlgJ-related protein
LGLLTFPERYQPHQDRPKLVSREKTENMKTKCCNTIHYTQKEETILCTNTRCVNYLTVTPLVKQNKVKRFLTAAWLFLFLVVFTSSDFSNTTSANVSKELSANFKRITAPLTREALKDELSKSEILCAEEAFAQILLESGNLNSFLVKHANNLMGMRYPCKRTTTAVGIYLPAKDTIIYGSQAELKKYAAQNNYAVYECWQDAVQDYKLWQKQYFKLTERYLQFLGNVYAEDSSYESKIRSVMAKN